MFACRGAFLAAVVFVGVGCYHATIETGAAPSNQVVEEEWAASWIGGLIRPETMETASQCPNGVARVETLHSFLNGLVAVLTGYIFTPMTIRVTCASGNAGDTEDEVDVVLNGGASEGQRQEVLELAAYRSLTEGRPILVRF